MNREYNSRVSSKNSERLLKNLKNTTGVYIFLPHPVHWQRIHSVIVNALRSETEKNKTFDVLESLPELDTLAVL